MALNSKVGSFMANTVTGVQSVTGLGFQPKVLLFFGCANTEVSLLTNQFVFFGAASSATQRFCVSAYSTTGATAANNSRSLHTNRCIYQVNATEAVFFEADLFSMDADGFSLNWANVQGTARRISFLALGGTDLSAKVGTFDFSAATGDQAVTGVGFQPGAVLFGGSITNITEGPVASSALMLGQAVSSTDRYVSAFFGLDAADPMDEQRVTYDNKCIVAIDNAGAVTIAADFVSQDADGFTINVGTASGAARRMGYVALGGTARFKGGTITAPLANSTVPVTGVGFSPEAALFASWNSSAAFNTALTDYSAINIGAFDKGGNNVSCVTVATNGVGTSVTGRNDLTNRCLPFASMVGGVVWNDCSGFLWETGADGFTLRFTPTNGVAYKSPFLAISGAADTAEYAPGLITRSAGLFSQEPAVPPPAAPRVAAPFGASAQHPGTHSFSGTVLEAGLPVARLVRAYRRDTGELVGETTSAGDGTFTLPTGHAQGRECFVVAFDDAGAAPALNAQVFDRVTGV